MSEGEIFMNYTKVPFVARITGVSALVALSKLCKLSFILGSFMARFSGINVMFPLVGAFTGMSGTFVVSGLMLALRILVYGFSFPSHWAAYYIPGIFASLYWARRSFFVGAIVPFV